MCKYCEETYYQNDYGRQFGKEFEKELSYTGDVCVSWLIENGQQVSHELYMKDDDCCCDISVPIQFCPKCGRYMTPHLHYKYVNSYTAWFCDCGYFEDTSGTGTHRTQTTYTGGGASAREIG